MCGLVGILNSTDHQPVRRRQLAPMVQAVSHRGPDGSGYHLDRYLGLGHSRLAVIDPTPSGAQPMLSIDGRFVISYNGTVFNFQQIRQDLEKLGQVFRSRSDTEVLLAAWACWGPECIPMVNGHFSFAVWDAQAEKLYLVRDRYGTKPLYFCRVGQGWLFASEIKAILANPAYSRQINLDALCEYFTFQNQFNHHTLFKGVQLLPPATILAIDGPSGKKTEQTFWDYDFNHPDKTMEFGEASQMVRKGLIRATERQLVADVPLGAYLSSGMDSGSIASIASGAMGGLRTFTCGWVMDEVKGVETSFDESRAAESLATHLNTDHHEILVGPNAVRKSLPRLIEALEDLRLGMSYGQWHIAQLAARSVKVALTGSGGDELFGGYPWRYYRVTRSLDREDFFKEFYGYWQRLIPEEMKDCFFTGQMREYKNRDTEMFRAMKSVFASRDDFSFGSPEDHVANSLYFEAKTFLHGLLLIGDKLSMAHGLEERHPFLDNDLVMLAQKIPVRHKLGDLEDWKRTDENRLASKAYLQHCNNGKNVLRKAMANILPPEVAKRRKQGFSSPDGSWFQGPNHAMLVELIGHKKALLNQFISHRTVAKAIELHSKGKKNLRLLLWSLLCFEIWLKIFFQEESPREKSFWPIDPIPIFASLPSLKP